MSALTLPALKDSKPLIAGLTLGLVLLAVWAFSSAYVSPASRECMALYRHAGSAADTLRVNATVPAASSHSTEARSCGSIRHTARWF